MKYGARQSMVMMQDAAEPTTAATGTEKNALLRQAVHRHKATSREGISERVFTALFSGLVYPQIWEDPLIDMEAMKLKPDEHVVAIM